MKHTCFKLLALSFLLLFSQISHAQWIQIDSGLTQVDLHDIHFPVDQEGFAVGDNGTLLHSTNYGNSWTSMSTPFSGVLNTVHFLTPSVGFIGGENGLSKTTDGGITWTNLILPDSIVAEEIEFIDSQTGICTGGFQFTNGRIYKTTDGGNTWHSVLPAGFGVITCAHFPSSTTGYAVQRGYNWEYLKTTDAGDTWTRIPINPTLTITSFEGVFFTSEQVGYLGGWYIGTFIKTSDGGSNWTNLDTTGTINLYSVHFPNPLEGFAVGFAGIILNTTDGGQTWAEQQWNNSNLVLEKVWFPSDTTGFVVGYEGTILKMNKAAGPTSNDPLLVNPIEISLYPNPVQDQLNITWQAKSPSQARFELFDLLGNRVRKQEINPGQNSLSTLGLMPGLYFYEVSNSNQKLAGGKVLVKP
ncbi:MAG: T9SS type A sorting domain-containing protein [Bacteroidia bacterium]|nr:T9SS type A sorting domain-containing protein [Bacteroidia bacterium]